MDDFDRYGTTDNLIRYAEAVRFPHWKANAVFKRMYVTENRDGMRKGFNWWWPRRDQNLKMWRVNIE